MGWLLSVVASYGAGRGAIPTYLYQFQKRVFEAFFAGVRTQIVVVIFRAIFRSHGKVPDVSVNLKDGVDNVRRQHVLFFAFLDTGEGACQRFIE